MSIKDIIDANLGTRLFVLEPAVRADASIRTMVVSGEVLDAVDGELPDTWEGSRLADFRQRLDAFTRGEEITVADNPFKKPGDCFMARVHPVELQVVDIRTLFRPGIRAFGAIGGRDKFVALTWDYREGMDFEYECRRCHHQWEQIFGSLDPFSKGRRLDECFTNVLAV